MFMPWSTKKVLPRHIRSSPRHHAKDLISEQVLNDVSNKSNTSSRKSESIQHSGTFPRVFELLRSFTSSFFFATIFRLCLALLFAVHCFCEWSPLTAIFEMTCYCSTVISHLIIVVLTFVSCITLSLFCVSPDCIFLESIQKRWIFGCLVTCQFLLPWFLVTLVNQILVPADSKLLTRPPKQGKLRRGDSMRRFGTRTQQLRFALGKFFAQNDVTAEELFTFLTYNEYHLPEFHALCIGAYSAPART